MSKDTWLAVALTLVIVTAMAVVLMIRGGVIDLTCYVDDVELEFGTQIHQSSVKVEYHLENGDVEHGYVVLAPTAYGYNTWQILDVPMVNAGAKCEPDYWKAMRDVESILRGDGMGMRIVPVDMVDYLVGIRKLQSIIFAPCKDGEGYG